METKFKNLTYKINENKSIECIYFFTDKDLHTTSDHVYLMVRLDGKEDPELHHIKEGVKKEFMNMPEDVIEAKAIELLDSYPGFKRS
jgi:hypothetical protein